VAAAERRRLRYHGYGDSIEKFLADTAADYCRRRAPCPTAPLNRAIEMAIDDEFAEFAGARVRLRSNRWRRRAVGRAIGGRVAGHSLPVRVYCTALVKSLGR